MKYPKHVEFTNGFTMATQEKNGQIMMSIYKNKKLYTEVPVSPEIANNWTLMHRSKIRTILLTSQKNTNYEQRKSNAYRPEHGCFEGS